MIGARLICWLTILASLAMVATSSAALPDEELKRAEFLYETGEFASAARIAESVHTVRGQTLAAQATLAVADYAAPAVNRPELYGEAVRLARAAIEYDAQKAEAYRYLVIALGHIARTRTLLEAFLEGYAEEGRRLIDRAMTLEPESPWTYALLGAWHAEIVAAAGALLADHLYGASAGKAVAAFETAVRLDPGNPVLHFEYANAMLRLGGSESNAMAREQLVAVVGLVPRDAVATIVRTQARQTLEELSVEDRNGENDATTSEPGDRHP